MSQVEDNSQPPVSSQAEGNPLPSVSSQVEGNLRPPASSLAVPTCEIVCQKCKIAELEEKLQVLESGAGTLHHSQSMSLLQEHLDAWAPTIFLLILLVSALASHPYPDLTLIILVILAFPFTLYLSLQQSQYIWPDPFSDEAYPCSVPPPD
ncbi:uncharacterized protein EDB93DRAFT_1253162 [Suillus bovinus]|uniref:uncharacterized protein n=1 Tax=Suillus bovinus TaxID=48563 RepID=UPI001B87FB05|nr:uncharacterized protein EDB93DRAFT_1253162 [Suillus bovinus]KAG2139097.1 hypothetical protein EDB93DRAFT_1253162 [Suillus bovinus]